MTGGAASRRKGATYERDVVAWLRANGLPYVERRIPGMSGDKGDVTGWPGVVIECKNRREFDLAGWVRQAEAERIEAGADHAAVFVKRRLCSDVGEHFVVLTAAAWLRLMQQAGWAIDRGELL